jgi:hypothetical protein
MPIWTGQGADNDWSTLGNWDTGVPTAAQPAIFNGSTGLNPNKNCIITSGASCSLLNCTGYTGQINFTNNLTVAANVTLGSGMTTTGTANLIITGTSTLTSAGVQLSGGLQFTPSTFGLTGTIADNWTIVGSLTRTGANGYTIAGSGGVRTITTQGSFTGTLTINNITIRMTGTGNLSGGAASTGGGSIEIDTAGIISHNGTFSLNGIVFTYINGTFNSTATLGCGANTVTFNNWGNISRAFFAFDWSANLGGQSVTLNSDIYVTNNLTFTGNAGGNFNGVGRTVFIYGNISGAGNGLGGTATVQMEGSTNASININSITNNLNINKSGAATVTILNPLNWGAAGRTLNIITGNNLILSAVLNVLGGTVTAVGTITGPSNLVIIGTSTLDIATGVTIPNLRANPAAAITITLIRTTVVTNFSKTGTGTSNVTFSSSTAGTELRITNYTSHTFNLGATLMGTNTTLRFMGTCTFRTFRIAGNVVLDTGATLTPIADVPAFSSSATEIIFDGNTTLNFSAGTLVLPAISNSNRLGTGFVFIAGAAHTINLGNSNAIDWVWCNNGPTITLGSTFTINKAINQVISTPAFAGGFNVIVKESLATSSTANWYQLNISGGGRFIYQSSATGFIGTGYIVGTTLFITSVTQGTLGYFSIVHVPSSTSTAYTQITNCTTFPTAGTGQYTVQTSMTVGSIGSPVTIYGFGIGFLGTNGVVEIDAGSNPVYLHQINLFASTSELRYLSTNTGTFDGSKARILNTIGGVGGSVDFQGQSSPTKFINRFSPGFSTNGLLNLKSDLYVNDFECQNSSGLTQSGGTRTLYVYRDFLVNNDGIRVLVPNIRLEGSSPANFTCTNLHGNVVIAKSGAATVTVTQNFNYGYATPTTFTYTSGIVNNTGRTITITGNSTFNTSGMTGSSAWNNFTINSGITLTLSSTLNINGNLLCNGSATFTGTAGWDCANLVSTAAGTFTITLQESITYRTRLQAFITGGVSGAARTTMISSNPLTRAIWTLDFGASQSLIYVNGTRIDSSQGQTVWTFGGLISTTPVGAETLNWNIGSPPGTFAYTFLN